MDPSFVGPPAFKVKLKIVVEARSRSLLIAAKSLVSAFEIA
jgi:hypothetical protein